MVVVRVPCGWEMDRDFASAGNKTRTSTGTKTKTWSVIFALHKQLGTEINIIQFLPFTLLIEELINNLIFLQHFNRFRDLKITW